MSETHRNALPRGYRLHWYEIDSVLGQGGFGITYLARDTNLDQLVAIKEFLPQELSVRDGDSSVHPLTEGHSETFNWGLSRFLTEARTLAKFRHPNIVTVHSVFEANHTAYMVMAYEHGASLAAALREGRFRGEAQIKSLIWPLLDGLELMHGEGFIHRDIKPANIYIREDGTPVLLDFGSARLALGGQTRTLTTLVSPGYAPFEQYETGGESGRQGPWTDIYSMGATLYLAVTGHGPPDAVTRANALLEGRTDPIVPASLSGAQGFSPGFLHAIDQALAFNAANRPRDVPQWRALLQAGGAPRSVESTVLRAEPRQRHEAASRQPPSARSSRRGLWWSAAVVLLGVAGGGLFLADRGLLDAVDALTSQEPAQSVPGASPAPVTSTADAVRPAPPAPEISLAQAEADEQAAALAAREEEARRAASEQARVAAENARIAELLRSAETDLRADRLVEPASPNALSRFREVLALQPDNTAALAGVSAVQDALVGRAREALAAGDLEQAGARLREVEAIDDSTPAAVELRMLYGIAESAVAAMRERQREQAEAEAAREAEAAASAAAEEQARQAEAAARAAAEAQAREREEEFRRQVEAERQRIQAEARRQVEEEARRAEEEARRQAAREAEREAEEAARQRAARAAEQQQVHALLAQAQAHMDELRMSGPPGHNALELLRQVMQIQPGNEQAQAGLDHIVAFYVDVAVKAARQGEPARAAGFLNSAALAGPGDPSVADARAKLAAGQLGAAAPAAAVAVPAPAVEPPPPPALPKVAYLGAFCPRCGTTDGDDIADLASRVRAAMEAASASLEVHSAPWDGVSAPLVNQRNPAGYWTGPRSMGAYPRAGEVADLATRAGADAALMAVVVELNQYHVGMFLVDTKTRQVFQTEGVLHEGRELTMRLLAQWSANR